jgi:hypothetical protein
MSRPLALLRHKACAAQDLQMVGDDLLRDSKLQRYLTNSKRPIANSREYAAPGAVGQRLQRSVDCFCATSHPLIQATICTNVNLWSRRGGQIQPRRRKK